MNKIICALLFVFKFFVHEIKIYYSAEVPKIQKKILHRHQVPLTGSSSHLWCFEQARVKTD